MAEHDTVIVTDYGHGLLDQTTMDLIQEQAPFLALNVQTNSSNFGYNPITRYARADTFALDETEIRLAFRDRGGDVGPMLQSLRDHFGAGAGWLTLGGDGALSVDQHGRLEHTPAFTLHVVDTLGAGDAFFALSSMAARLEQPASVGSLLGGLAGAMAANVQGNTEAVDRTVLQKFAATVLNV
jgi:sugar/nucleoside kinase (ribokinase family)